MSAPLPPDDVASRRPEVVTLTAGTVIERFFSVQHDPIYFDRSRAGRFGSPDASYGVLYAAASLRGAFAETFLREPGRTLLPIDLLRAKARIRLKIARTMKLVELAGPGLARLGATAEVTHGGLPYDVPQAWSKAIHDHPTRPDGIAYRARHDDDAICYAIYDRGASPLREETREMDIDQDWLWELADLYGVGLAPS